MQINDTQTMLPHAMYASISRRFGALLLDGIILAIFGCIAANIVPFLGGLIVWFFYAPIFESSAIRATLGKHLMGIQVSDLAGRRISFRASLIRNLMKLVSSAILFIGYVFALFSSRKQTLHDLLADTTVVYGRSEASIADAWVEEVKALFRSNETPIAPGSAAASDSPNATFSYENRGSVADQLERLQALRDRGSITAEEFEAAKRKILS